MFYLFAAFWVICTLVAYAIRHARVPYLYIISSFLTIGSILLAIILYAAHQPFVGVFLLVFGLILALVVLLAAFVKRSRLKEKA
jgi:hypothetical protein